VAQEPEKSDSVFDFLYVDNRRIGLYLSQFSQFGNLTNLVESVATTDTSRVEGSFGISSTKVGTHVDTVAQTGVQRHYDTQWTAPLSFLEEIQARQMLKRELQEARVGDLVILPGTLTLANMRVFARTFEASSKIFDEPSHDPRQRHKRQQLRQAATSPPPFSSSAGLQMLASFEQPIFMVFQAARDRLWSTIDPESLIGSEMDLHLKHGLTVAGTWHVVGILDCLPAGSSAATLDIGRICGDAANEFSEAFKGILVEHRMLMGRPSTYYGITPLIIMRQVS
jgi:hypothetical protein